MAKVIALCAKVVAASTEQLRVWTCMDNAHGCLYKMLEKGSLRTDSIDLEAANLLNAVPNCEGHVVVLATFRCFFAI